MKPLSNWRRFLTGREGSTWHDFAISFLLIVVVMLFILLIYKVNIPMMLYNILMSLEAG